MAERVPFVVTAFGLDVDPFMLHIYAAVAQRERALIFQRTKEALKGRVLSGNSLRKLTLETEKAIFDPYSNGTPAVQLAEMHGVSRQAITEAVRRPQGRAIGGRVMKLTSAPPAARSEVNMDRILLKFVVGQRVVKEGEDSRFEGEVVSCFVKRNHKTTRYVVESDDGVLHIASEKMLRLVSPKRL
jgi:hypothetical protein